MVAFWKGDALAVYSWSSLEKLLRAKRSLKSVDADFVLPVSRAGELPVALLDTWRAVFAWKGNGQENVILFDEKRQFPEKEWAKNDLPDR